MTSVSAVRRLGILAAAVVVLAGGCAFFRSSKLFREPRLVFKNVALQDASLQSITLNTVWSLENPNPIGLALAEVEYALFIEGKQVVAGKPPNGLRVRAGGATDLEFPANVKFQDIAPVVQTFLTKDFASYRAQGAIGIQTPIGILKFPIVKDGQFEVPKIPAVALDVPRIASISLQGATVELPLTVTNRNSYDLPVNGFTANVLISGASVGNVSTGDLGRLGGRAARQVTLPVSVNFLQAGAAAMALRSGSGTVSLNGNLHSGGTSVPINLSQNVRFRR